MNKKTTPCPHCGARGGWTYIHEFVSSDPVHRKPTWVAWSKWAEDMDPFSVWRHRNAWPRPEDGYQLFLCNACGEAVS